MDKPLPSMIIGIISDAHGNYEGLNRCLIFLKERCNKIFFLGDAVGYFPFPNEVIDMLRENEIECLKGNHDAMLVGELGFTPEKDDVYKMTESRKKISVNNFDFLKSLSPLKKMHIGGKSILFIHGSPLDPLNGYVYPDTNLGLFENNDSDIIIMGHTHRSFFTRFGGKLYINAGSCGFSRDNGNKITAVILDTLTDHVLIHDFIIDKDDLIQRFAPSLHEAVINVLNRNNIYEA